MNLRNTREIKDFASRRLEESASQKQIVTIYIGLALGLTALVTVLNHVLGLQIDNVGGLSNLGKRTMLSSIQSMLPLAQSILAMCLDVGYVAAIPIVEVIRGINAFTLGVRSVNPEAVVHVRWSGSWVDSDKEKEVANA